MSAPIFPDTPLFADYTTARMMAPQSTPRDEPIEPYNPLESRAWHAFHGSNPAETRAFLAALERHQRAGWIAASLFRAQKASTRAKRYSRAYSDLAYKRKEQALAALVDALGVRAADLGIRWGWKIDSPTAYAPWVLYVDLPTGQVSFHARHRLAGPDYAADWDGVAGASAPRILRWLATLVA